MSALYLAAGVLLLGACGPKTSTSGGGSDEDTALSTSWEIGGMLDEFVLRARFEPQRPKAGEPATLIASGSVDDMERPFKGEIWYRIVKSELGQEPWQPMALEVEKNGEATFRTSVTLPAGKPYVQFKVKRIYDEQPAELLDWWVPID